MKPTRSSARPTRRQARSNDSSTSSVPAPSLPRESLARSVEALRKRVAEELPAAKGKLNAAKLLEQAQTNVDRQIANEQATLDTLTGLLDEFDKAR